MNHALCLAATIALSALAFAACDRGASKVKRVSSQEREVLVAGNETTAQHSSVAVYWRNGARTQLGQGASQSIANSVYATGADIYVAGFEETAPSTAVALYWLNGRSNYLSNGHQNDTANSVFVSDGKVCVAGVEFNSATVWVNGVSQALSRFPSEATSVYVSDGDVYVSGWEVGAMGKRYAVLWVNGKLRRLSAGGKNDAALSVKVSDDTVYVAGYEEVNNMTVATLWKNGSPTQVGQNGANSFAKCVYVAGDEVHVVLDENGYAKISTNGKKHLITDKSSRVHSVHVSGGDVYTAGVQGGQAKLWLNNAQRRLEISGTSRTSEARSVFVL